MEASIRSFGCKKRPNQFFLDLRHVLAVDQSVGTVSRKKKKKRKKKGVYHTLRVPNWSEQSVGAVIQSRSVSRYYTNIDSLIRSLTVGSSVVTGGTVTLKRK